VSATVFKNVTARAGVPDLGDKTTFVETVRESDPAVAVHGQVHTRGGAPRSASGSGGLARVPAASRMNLYSPGLSAATTVLDRGVTALWIDSTAADIRRRKRPPT
jgi:hypothetical protein